MQLSIIIPVFNGAQYIKQNINLLAQFLSSRSENFEIVIVNDGSTDNTDVILQTLKSYNIHIISLPHNQGKFFALKAGIKASNGGCKIFIDADLPFDLESLIYLEELITKRDIHIAIGDRSLKESEYSVQMNYFRRVATYIFSLLVRIFVAGGLYDTQCGLKAFRADVANAIFPLLHGNGYSGDVELLYVALQYNLEIKRIPVRFRQHNPSTVNLLSHGLLMLLEIVQIRRRWNRGEYHCDRLRQIGNQKYWN